MIDCLYSFLWLEGRGKLIFGNYYNYVKQLLYLFGFMPK